MAEPTPGPWISRHCKKGVEINAETRDEIAWVILDDVDVDALAETEANLDLILSAPSMRQEIKRLKDQLRARDAVITGLKADLEIVYRKISHGCTDMSCKECDR